MCRHVFTEEIAFAEPLPEPTPGIARYRRCTMCWRPVRFSWVECAACKQFHWSQAADAESICGTCAEQERRERIRIDALRDALLTDAMNGGGKRGQA